MFASQIAGIPDSGQIISVPAADIDCSQGNYFQKNLSSLGSITFTVSNVPTGRVYIASLFLYSDPAMGTTITWWPGIQWGALGSISGTNSNVVSLLSFLTPDGGTTWIPSYAIEYPAPV